MQRLMTALLAFNIVVFNAFGTLPVAAQTATDALAAQWSTICAAANAGELLVRCTEMATSSASNAYLIAASGQRWEEIPGQARIATRSDGKSDSHPKSNRKSEKTNDNDLIPRWSVFTAIETGQLDRKQSSHEAAFEAKSDHLTLGADWRIGARGLVGTIVSLDQEDLDYTNSLGSAVARYRQIIGFTNYIVNEAWTVNSYLGTANGDYDLVRWINYSLPTTGGGSYHVEALAVASPESRRQVAGLNADWNWAHANWQVGLNAGFDYSKINIDTYTETGGSGLALDVPKRQIKTQRSRLDARISRTHSTTWGVWQPSLRLGWHREFANERRQITVQLTEDISNTPVTFDTEDPDRNWGEIALGSVFVFTHGHSGFFELRQRVSHNFLNERVLAFGWRMEL